MVVVTGFVDTLQSMTLPARPPRWPHVLFNDPDHLTESKLEGCVHMQPRVTYCVVHSITIRMINVRVMFSVAARWDGYRLYAPDIIRLLCYRTSIMPRMGSCMNIDD